MRTIIFSPEAERDLFEIWDYIANDSIDAADRVRDRIRAAVVKLAERPGIGHVRADVRDPRYRFWKVYSYLIAYRYDHAELVVVRIEHGARDFRLVFGPR